MRDKKCEIKMRDKNAIGKNKDRPARTPNVVLWLRRIIKAFVL